MTITIGGKLFKCLIDTGADRIAIRKEEAPPSWKLIPGPPIQGVGGQSPSWVTSSWLPWEDPSGNRGEVQPLVVGGITANLLGQDILGAAEAVITTDNRAFYDDILDEEEYQQQYQLDGRLSNYRDDPHFEQLRQRKSNSPQSGQQRFQKPHQF